MKKMFSKVFLSTVLLLFFFGNGYTQMNDAVSTNGQLQVIGLKLCNQYGNPIQLRGMSTHGIQWFESCITNASLDALANDWDADVLRISLYVQESGYDTDPVGFTAKVAKMINMATDRGMYALVDWHQLNPGDPNYNTKSAAKFFTDIATQFKGYNNIIYDICNEPNGVPWSSIKNYADTIIPVIRAIDRDAPILIGTHGWGSLGISDGAKAQDIVSNPVRFSNIMYTFHFYAASHGSAYLNELDWASDRLPIFVTEFGSQTATGDGVNDFTMTQQYIDLLNTKKISWINWNYSDDFRSGAVWNTGTSSSGTNAWIDANLKESGVWIKDKMLNPADDFPTGTTVPVPTQYDYTDNVAPSVDPPGGLAVSQVPMFVSVGWDDNAISGDGPNYPVGGVRWIIDFLATKTNPAGAGNKRTYDGTPALNTFLSTSSPSINGSWGENATYIRHALREAMVKGHEVGNHTRTHLKGLNGTKMTENQWFNAMNNCNTDFMKPYPAEGIGLTRMFGFRAPRYEFNNNTFKVIKRLGIMYDCSGYGGSAEHTVADGKHYYWPYTMDNGLPGKGTISNHPGIWRMPKHGLIDTDGKKYSSTDYTLLRKGMDATQFLGALKHTLDLRMAGNRSPFIFGGHTEIYTDGSTFVKAPQITPAERRRVIEEFLNYALTFPEVRIVSTKQILDWVRKPVALNDVSNNYNPPNNSQIDAVTPPVAPEAPSTLSATAVSTSQIDLSWADHSSNEDLFRIERSANGTSGWTSIAAPRTNEISYSNIGLTANTTYYYRVRAENATGNSAYSNTVNATSQNGNTGDWDIISNENFETSWGIWNGGGANARLYTGYRAHQGDKCMAIQDNTNTSVVTTNNLNLSGYTDLKVDFWYYSTGMEVGEDYWLQISTDGGASFTTVKVWTSGTDFSNDAFHQESITINSLTLTNTTQLRFRCDASDYSDDIFLDEIVISATTVGTTNNIALGKKATASSLETTSYPASFAVDGSGATRWASAEKADPQWIHIDLGGVATIERVVLNWETAHATAYRIEVSNDGAAWTSIYSTSRGNGGIDDLSVSGTGRYIRVYGTARGTSYGYSLYEFEVYGTIANTAISSLEPLSVLKVKAYPNPFTNDINYAFDLIESAHVTLKLFSLQGIAIDVIIDKALSAGNYVFRYNGASLNSGVYIYTMQLDTGEVIYNYLIK